MNAIARPSSIALAGGDRVTFRGLGTLVRKDVTEWRRGRRAWAVALSVSFVMVITAANSWIVTELLARMPDAEAPETPLSMAPMHNFMAALSAQIFVVAAVLAVASLLVRERETGTLAWIATKPVSRDTIFLSKVISATAMLAIVAVIVPVVATSATVALLYGVIDPVSLAILTAGAVAAVVFFAAVGLAASTVLPGQVALVALGFTVFAVGPMLGGMYEPLEAILPTSILGWAAGLVGGAPVGWITPVAWAIGTGGLIVFGTRRLRAAEL